MAHLEKSNSEEKSKGFEKIFDIVGGHGPFQWALVAVLSLLVYFNLFLIIQQVDHCKHVQ
jgi:hypothetical protein